MNNYLLVGLGNVGEKFENTRHNVGFIFVDFFAREYNVNFRESKYAYLGAVNIDDKNIKIIKPTTFVNNSGVAVRYWMNWLKIDITRILIIVDDVNLDFCSIKFRERGSSGGHNGLKSIEQNIGQNYARLKFGIGHDFEYGEQSDYVLQHFSEDEMLKINEKKEVVLDRINNFFQIKK